ncbi:MAG: hypothetical protein J0H64_05185 [Actinobacteria bacterium]|nr:hypothetical protein [Actinomycetota bacterium]
MKPNSDAGDLETYESSLSGSEAERFRLALLGPSTVPRVSITMTTGAKVDQPGGGCFAEANTRVYGSVKAELQLVTFVNELYSQADTHAIVDAVKKGTPSYEKCMSEAGYPVQGLGAAELAAERFGAYRLAGDPPSADEAALAEQDARCQEKAELVKKADEVFFTGASKWILTNESMILAREVQLKTALKNAKKILNE